MRKYPGRHAQGFTFIEVLTVSVTVLLALTVLIPLVSHSREQTQMIQCQSSLRLMGVANALYGAEFDGWTWPFQVSNQVEKGKLNTRWHENQHLLTLMGETEPLPDGSAGYTVTDRELVCPNAVNVLTYPIVMDGKEYFSWRNSYGINIEWIKGRQIKRGEFVDLPIVGIKNHDIPSPDSKIQFADGNSMEIQFAPTKKKTVGRAKDYSIGGGDVGDRTPEGKWYPRVVAWRHMFNSESQLGFSNILYFDGHVGVKSTRDLVANKAGEQLWRADLP